MNEPQYDKNSKWLTIVLFAICFGVLIYYLHHSTQHPGNGMGVNVSMQIDSAYVPDDNYTDTLHSEITDTGAVGR